MAPGGHHHGQDPVAEQMGGAERGHGWACGSEVTEPTAGSTGGQQGPVHEAWRGRLVAMTARLQGEGGW